MINVPIDKIIPLTTARDTLSKIVAEVETSTPMYVLTKGGKPSVAVVNIDYLEKALNGQLMTETVDDSLANQDVSPGQATETLSDAQDQQSMENALESPETPSTESLPEPPPIDEPSQASAETPAPSTPPPSTPSTQPQPNIALGSMDGIQPQTFVPPPPATKPIDKNYTPNPAQYAGPPNPPTGTGDPKTSDLPDMVID